MRRREFITLLGGAATAWPLAARAQQRERMRRIGALMGYPEAQSEFASFVQELQKLGWAEGRNLRTDVDSANCCAAATTTPGDAVQATVG